MGGRPPVLIRLHDAVRRAREEMKDLAWVRNKLNYGTGGDRDESKRAKDAGRKLMDMESVKARTVIEFEKLYAEDKKRSDPNIKPQDADEIRRRLRPWKEKRK